MEFKYKTGSIPDQKKPYINIIKQIDRITRNIDFSKNFIKKGFSQKIYTKENINEIAKQIQQIKNNEINTIKNYIEGTESKKILITNNDYEVDISLSKIKHNLEKLKKLLIQNNSNKKQNKDEILNYIKQIKNNLDSLQEEIKYNNIPLVELENIHKYYKETIGFKILEEFRFPVTSRDIRKKYTKKDKAFIKDYTEFYAKIRKDLANDPELKNKKTKIKLIKEGLNLQEKHRNVINQYKKDLKCDDTEYEKKFLKKDCIIF
jgi:hypothetical protein